MGRPKDLEDIERVTALLQKSRRPGLAKCADTANPLTAGEPLVDMFEASRQKGEFRTAAKRVRRLLQSQQRADVIPGVTRDKQTIWEMREYYKFLRGKRKERPTSAESYAAMKRSGRGWVF